MPMLDKARDTSRCRGVPEAGLYQLRHVLFHSFVFMPSMPVHHHSLTLDFGKAGVRISEAIQRHPHPVHQRQVQAAEFAVLIAFVPVVKHPAGRQRSAQAADRQDGKRRVVVLGTGEHIREPQQARIVQNRTLTLSVESIGGFHSFLQTVEHEGESRENCVCWIEQVSSLSEGGI